MTNPKMLNICINRKSILVINNDITFKGIHKCICERLNIPLSDYYLLQNGKIIRKNTIINNMSIEIAFRVCGGKGGFGAMLRAMGAQNKKCTNTESCKDLNGRRLRVVNKEKRLKEWLSNQAEREQDTETSCSRKREKLEKLCEVPQHKFQDEEFDKERLQLSEVVEAAVIQGMEMISGIKRRKNNEVTRQNKKLKLWIDEEVEDLSSDDSEASDSEDSGYAASSETLKNSDVLISTSLSKT